MIIYLTAENTQGAKMSRLTPHPALSPLLRRLRNAEREKMLGAAREIPLKMAFFAVFNIF
jgi:hypothetical protein